MSNPFYKDLYNESNFDGDFISIDSLTVNSELDVSTATVIGLPVDNITIQNSGNILSVKNGGINTAQLADNSVNSFKIQDNAIITAKILDNAVTTLKIADSNVTDAKIVSVSASKITGAFVGLTSDYLALTNTSNQLLLGTVNIATISATPSTPSLFTIPDVGNSDFVMTEGAQIINGVKTFSSPIKADILEKTGGDLSLLTLTSGDINIFPASGFIDTNQSLIGCGAVNSFGSNLILSTSVSGDISLSPVGNINCNSKNITSVADMTFSGTITGPTIRNLSGDLILKTSSSGDIQLFPFSGVVNCKNSILQDVGEINRTNNPITIQTLTSGLITINSAATAINLQCSSSTKLQVNSTGVNLPTLTASTALTLDGSKNIISTAFTSSNTVSTIMSRDSSGNTAVGSLTCNTGIITNSITNLSTDITINTGSSITNFSNGGVKYKTTGGTATELNYNEELNTTWTASGPFAATFNIHIRKIGNHCTLQWANVNGTSTSSAVITMTAIPARFFPWQDVNSTGQWGSNSSANVAITAVLTTAGVMKFGVGATQAAFASGGTCSCWSGTFHYSTN